MKANFLSVLFLVAVLFAFVSYWLTGYSVEAAIAKGEAYKDACVKVGNLNRRYCDCVGNWMADVEAPYTLIDRSTLGWFWSSEEAQKKYAASRRSCESFAQ